MTTPDEPNSPPDSATDLVGDDGPDSNRVGLGPDAAGDRDAQVLLQPHQDPPTLDESHSELRLEQSQISLSPLPMPSMLVEYRRFDAAQGTDTYNTVVEMIKAEASTRRDQNVLQAVHERKIDVADSERLDLAGERDFALRVYGVFGGAGTTAVVAIAIVTQGKILLGVSFMVLAAGLGVAGRVLQGMLKKKTPSDGSSGDSEAPKELAES